VCVQCAHAYSASLEPSYVLRALGVSEDMAHTSLRFGIGRFTTVDEIGMASVLDSLIDVHRVDYTIENVARVVAKLREMSVLAEMAAEGIDIAKVQWGAAH
jgi:cysteine desulfurase